MHPEPKKWQDIITDIELGLVFNYQSFCSKLPMQIHIISINQIFVFPRFRDEQKEKFIHLLIWHFKAEKWVIPRVFPQIWYQYVCAKYKSISERYQGAENYIFYYQICVFITFNCTIVNQCELLCKSKLYAYIFDNSIHFQMLYN